MTQHTRSIDALVLRRAGGVTAVIGVIAAIIGYVTSQMPGLIGAALATIIVLGFFSAGQFVLGRVLANNPQIALSVALMLYLAKVGVLLILVILLAGTTAFNTDVFALTILACTLAWTMTEVWIFASTKVLYVDPEARS
jgi:ATP synthase protein I